VEALLARRPRAPSIVDRAKPEVPATEVRVDNEISPIFTVLDIFTEDKPGVLYTITRTLSEHGLDIHRSRWAWPATEWPTSSTSGTLPRAAS